jgi:hypothetical protein
MCGGWQNHWKKTMSKSFIITSLLLTSCFNVTLLRGQFSFQVGSCLSARPILNQSFYQPKQELSCGKLNVGAFWGLALQTKKSIWEFNTEEITYNAVDENVTRQFFNWNTLKDDTINYASINVRNQYFRLQFLGGRAWITGKGKMPHQFSILLGYCPVIGRSVKRFLNLEATLKNGGKATTLNYQAHINSAFTCRLKYDLFKGKRFICSGNANLDYIQPLVDVRNFEYTGKLMPDRIERNVCYGQLGVSILYRLQKPILK